MVVGVEFNIRYESIFPNFWMSVWGVTRSLFNYLVPMLQDKRAEEEETEGEALGLST